MKYTKDFILKIRFLIIAILTTLFVKFSIRFFSLNSAITKVQKKSVLFLSINDPTESINRINFWYGRLNNFLRIKSCLVNSLIKKLIFLVTIGEDRLFGRPGSYIKIRSRRLAHFQYLILQLVKNL